MNAPDFDYLAIPPEYRKLLDPLPRWIAERRAYQEGARHGHEQARQLWPEPITDRPPTFEDGDEEECFICDAAELLAIAAELEGQP